MNKERSGYLFGRQRYASIAMALVIFCAPVLNGEPARAAACTPPSTDYGQVTGMSVSVNTAATYRVWTRMAAPSTTSNTYLLEIDGNQCYVVGGNGVPVYAQGAATYFTASTTHWTNKTSTGTVISLPLTAGTHTIKMIGNAAGVVVDRLIMTTSTTCLPSGDGSNCTDAIAPVISAITSTSVTQNGATINWTTDTPATTQVEYGTTSSYGSLTTHNPALTTQHTVTLASLQPGTVYHYRVISTDEAGNMTNSGDSTFTTASTSAYLLSDINQDGVTGILDVSVMAVNWQKTGAGVGRSDINGDGVVNGLDLSLLIADYGR